MNSVIISLGSNIEPEKNIAEARSLLANEYSVVRESEFIRTKPIGYLDQDDFINGSILIETTLPEQDLKLQLKEMEKKLGRQRSNIKFGPRTIDLDIVVWNETIVDNDVYERDFLKNSVLELLPSLHL